MLTMIKLFFFNTPNPELKRIQEEILDLRASFRNQLI